MPNQWRNGEENITSMKHRRRNNLNENINSERKRQSAKSENVAAKAAGGAWLSKWRKLMAAAAYQWLM